MIAGTSFKRFFGVSMVGCGYLWLPVQRYISLFAWFSKDFSNKSMNKYQPHSRSLRFICQSRSYLFALQNKILRCPAKCTLRKQPRLVSHQRDRRVTIRAFLRGSHPTLSTATEARRIQKTIRQLSSRALLFLFS